MVEMLYTRRGCERKGGVVMYGGPERKGAWPRMRMRVKGGVVMYVKR